jgi:uncharacterized membrane protein
MTGALDSRALRAPPGEWAAMSVTAAGTSVAPKAVMAPRRPDSTPPTSDPAADNVRAIVELERGAATEKTWSDRISDRIARFAGSLWFVLLHLAAFAAWSGWNTLAPVQWQFDPYPYGLLTFIVSMEGVLIATFVLITQNRMSQRSEQRDHLHLQVALLTEQELTLVLGMLRRISESLQVPPQSEEAARAEKLTEQTNIYELMSKLKQELPSTEDS